MTDLNALLGLCAQADADRAARERASVLDDQAEAVNAATDWAKRVLGAEVAAVLGEWTPVDLMDDDTLQAYVEISPTAYLRCTAHVEDGTWLELISHCPHCGHCREERIGSLSDLAVAMRNAGVR